MHPRSTRAIASYSRWTAGRFRVWTVSPGCSRGTDAVALGMSDRALRSSRVPSWRPPSAWRRRRWKSWTRDQNQTRSGRRSAVRSRTRSSRKGTKCRRSRGCFRCATRPSAASARRAKRFSTFAKTTCASTTSCSSTRTPRFSCGSVLTPTRTRSTRRERSRRRTWPRA